jgi:hypothetical protein
MLLKITASHAAKLAMIPPSSTAIIVIGLVNVRLATVSIRDVNDATKLATPQVDTAKNVHCQPTALLITVMFAMKFFVNQKNTATCAKKLVTHQKIIVNSAETVAIPKTITA